mmetsp:Transcript_26480/g.68786  ORF Transcript_26480/g.68786 Transcript_26480/m.68786 type:complete len:240 (-) Transcript_26480:72-791(-)
MRRDHGRAPRQALHERREARADERRAAQRRGVARRRQEPVDQFKGPADLRGQLRGLAVQLVRVVHQSTFGGLDAEQVVEVHVLLGGDGPGRRRVGDALVAEAHADRGHHQRLRVRLVDAVAGRRHPQPLDVRRRRPAQLHGLFEGGLDGELARAREALRRDDLQLPRERRRPARERVDVKMGERFEQRVVLRLDLVLEAEGRHGADGDGDRTRRAQEHGYGLHQAHCLPRFCKFLAANA